ncbi:hypothetical protein F5X99DRAFT_23955 [Biscogniauxia marginata]|nr:hypothetical protein F5X99DRAFT_23955 [Biscogniauxia marginata]
MARLNEPIVSTDSLETLRRKFLRQNRDIARTNSTQSLKIRSLENECARMLSENLELRGQIIRLETELQESRAQRIADHALEIKAKMEAQLVEWGAMLAGLGHEPVPRNRSPRAAKKAKTRNSLSRTSWGRTSMSEWRRRDTMSSMKDLEAAALQEGRLPPLWEDKSYPRETLSREEILALREVVEDGGDSPDLGPPPVSRFVDEDPVKIDLPTKYSVPNHTESPTSPQKSSKKPEDRSPPRAITTELEEASPKNTEPTGAKSTTIAATTTEPLSISPAGKASLKRKTRDEDEKEDVQPSRPPPQPTLATKSQNEKTTNAKVRSVGRPIKNLPSKRDARQGLTTSTQRKPLGAKSSNDIINSPKKVSAKPPVQDEVSKAKADLRRDEQSKERTRSKKEAIQVEIPALPPPPAPVASIEVEQDNLSPEPHLTVPDSPEPLAPKEEIRDTPPPSDISYRGETSRGSRRARTAVSYAEPNLRDKMRRPTKQLFDAVSGEGKHMRRTSQSKKDEPQSGPSSVAKSEGRDSCRDISTVRSTSTDPNHPDIMASPLVQKTARSAPLDDLPTSVTDRKKRNSSAVVPGSDSESSGRSSTKPASKGSNRRLEEIAAREEEVAKMFDGPDVYEFTTSSPKDEPKNPVPEEEEAPPKKRGSRQPRSRRLSSMAAHEDLAEQPDSEGSSEKAAKGAHPRKRASMMLPKKSRMDVDVDADQPDGGPSNIEGDSLESSSSAEADGSATQTQSRASMRRRSMML